MQRTRTDQGPPKVAVTRCGASDDSLTLSVSLLALLVDTSELKNQDQSTQVSTVPHPQLPHA